jgi:hypothetical protein
MITDNGPDRALDETIIVQEPAPTLTLLQQKYAPVIRMRNERIENRRLRRKAEKRVRDADRARYGRAKKKAAKELSAASLEALVAMAKEHRLALLTAAVQRPKGDKRLEQLVGREEDLATFWQARELARHQHGSATSDAQVANVYRGLSADPDFNRHKARSRHRIVRFLEEPGMPWNDVLLSLPMPVKVKWLRDPLPA